MSTTLPELPAVREAHNMRLVGHSNLGGKGDGMHVNVVNGRAYVGHMGHTDAATSVVDVSDPRQPRMVNQLPRRPGTHSHKVQIVDDILLVNHERNPWEPQTTAGATWSAGVEVFSLRDPDQPRSIGFFDTPGKGVHRMTYWTAPYAYVTGSDTGFIDQFLRIVDLSEPTRPREVGRWWFAGQNTGAGEQPSWTPIEGHGLHAAPGEKRVALHHALVRGDRAYCGWWDAGLVILDISQLSQPRLVSHLDFGSDVSGATHTAFPVPGRDIVVVTDEQLGNNCEGMLKHVRVVDISNERQPRVISTFPTPEGDYCARGGRFGPHNVHEMRPGTWQDHNTIYVTYFNAGVRAFDISDPHAPREVAYIVPDAPPGRESIQLNDLVATADGLIYATDRYAGGLYIFERTG